MLLTFTDSGADLVEKLSAAVDPRPAPSFGTRPAELADCSTAGCPFHGEVFIARRRLLARIVAEEILEAWRASSAGAPAAHPPLRYVSLGAGLLLQDWRNLTETLTRLIDLPTSVQPSRVEVTLIDPLYAVGPDGPS